MLGGIRVAHHPRGTPAAVLIHGRHLHPGTATAASKREEETDGIIRETYTAPAAVPPHVLSHSYLEAAFFKALSTGYVSQQPSDSKLGKRLKMLISTPITLKTFSAVAIMPYSVSAQNLFCAVKAEGFLPMLKKPLLV